MHVLGIDAGGTKTVCYLADEAGAVLATGRGPGANLQVAGELEVEKVLHQVMDTALDGRHDIRPRAICLGIAGVDREHDSRIVGPVDPGDAEADAGRPDVEIADRLLHDVVEDLLDLELARRLQVGAAAAGLGQDVAVLVGQLTDGLGASGVDAEYVDGGLQAVSTDSAAPAARRAGCKRLRRQECGQNSPTRCRPSGNRT